MNTLSSFVKVLSIKKTFTKFLPIGEMPELVDWDGLEIRRLRKGSEGSNPSLSFKASLREAFFYFNIYFKI